MENNRSKDNAAKYAKVYNQILKMIQDGMYREGSKLISEPILASELKVSRSTLRQALALLQEDGILEAKRGVGNFVRKTTHTNQQGLETMSNPIHKSCLEEINETSINIIPGISTAYTERIFDRKMPVVLGVHRYYKKQKVNVAYCFSHIATDFEYLNELDLNNEEDFLAFLENRVYEIAHSKKCEVEVVKETDNLHGKHIQNKTGLFMMIRENIIDINGKVIIVNKFYIPIEYASVKVFCNN
ncbi:MAG: GntR family transcriptional regulator [Longicatena sp.]